MAAPRIITMTATKRGALGDGRYRSFAEGESYVVSEATGPADTVSPFLADQFVKNGVAEAVDVSTGDVSTAEPAEKALADHTVKELTEKAEALDVEIPKGAKKAEIVALVEAALAAKAKPADAAGTTDGEADGTATADNAGDGETTADGAGDGTADGETEGNAGDGA